MKTKYYLITTRENTPKNDSAKLCGNNLRQLKRVARFIFRHCEPKSVVIVNMKGKVGFYKVKDAPQKAEDRGARQMF